MSTTASRGGRSGRSPAASADAGPVARWAARAASWGTPVVVVAVVVALFAIVSAYREKDEFVASTAGALLLLSSYIGFGAVLGRRLYPGRALGWGLEGALGMAFALVVGGALAVLHLVSSGVVWGCVALGVAALAIERHRRRHAIGRALRRRLAARDAAPLGLVVLGLYALLALQFVGAAGNVAFNVWDDNMAYRGFARQLLDSGTLYEPLSYRRIGSLCGQSYLHAMVLAVSSPTRLHLLDNGICVALLFGLIVGYRRPSPAATLGARVVALAVLLTLPHAPHNIASEMSGTVFFLALFRLAEEPSFRAASLRAARASGIAPGRGRAAWANPIAVGLLASAACTLRQNYIAVAAVFVVALYAAHALAAHQEDDRGRGSWRASAAWLVEAARAGALTAAFVAPWMILTYVAAHTFLYPLWKGTTRPDFGMLGKVTWAEELRWLVMNVFHLWPIRTLPVFFAAAFALRARRSNAAIHALLAATLLGFVALVHLFQAFDQVDSLGRYYLAFTLALALAVTLRALSMTAAFGAPGASSMSRIAPAALVLIGAVMQAYDVRSSVDKLYIAWITSAEKRGTAEPHDTTAAFYRRMQLAVPPGATMAVMVDETHQLDGERNRIFDYDQPGALSPAPGVPYFEGPERFAEYFVSIGVRYIAFGIGESSPEFKYSLWRQRLAEAPSPSGRGGLFRGMARFFLDAFASLDALTRSRAVLFHEKDYWVLDLATPVPEVKTPAPPEQPHP